MLIDGLNYKIYKELIDIFLDISMLFEISKDKEKFQNKIYSTKTFIPKNIYLKLTSDTLKEKLDKIYLNLVNQNIKIISINSKQYPKNLLNIHNPPLAIFTYGDVIFNNKKSIYIYSDNLSDFGKKVYKYFNYYIKNKMISIGTSKECDIIVKKDNIFDTCYKNNVTCPCVIIPYNSFENEIVFGIIDYLLIIEAKYNKETKDMVNCVVEYGKEILVVPGNIFNKNHYFSNYLIQEGATVLLNKTDLDKFI